MASARAKFPDLEDATFISALNTELGKHGTSLSAKGSEHAHWKDSGETAAKAVWNQTIRPFRDNFKKDKKDGLTRLNDDPVVLDYLWRAIEAIASKAAALAEAEGGAPLAVDGWHVLQASHWVIKRFRAVCPPQIAKGTFENDTKLKWAHGDLCRDYETREE